MRTQHTLHTLPAFPVYSAGFVSDKRLILGGGGGTGRSGIRNKLRMYDIEKSGEALNLVTEAELGLGEDAPMTIAINPSDGAVVCGANASEESVAKGGVNEHCRLYRAEADSLALEAKKQVLATTEVEAYQNVTAFSRDFKFIAVGTSSNEVTILAYPSLAIVSETFKIPSGILYGLDFSEETLLAITSTALHFIHLPLNIVASKSTNTSEKGVGVTLPTLEPAQSIEVPGLDVLSANDDGAVRTFRAGRFNPTDPNTLYAVINSTPAPGSGRGKRSGGKKVERRAFLVRYEIAPAAGAAAASGAAEKQGTKAEKKGEDKWVVKKVRNIGKRAVTVFTVSENGKLAAYGASDSSVGIVDTRTFAPLLEILKSHDFPPTLLTFNAPATLLVSGSADASVRVIVVPEFFTSSSTLYIVILVALLAVLAAVLLQRG